MSQTEEDSVINPSAPVTAGTLSSENQTWLQVSGVVETLDPHRMEHRAKLIGIACDITSVAKRYRKIHDGLFGFSVRKIVMAAQPGKLTDLASLEAELDSIDAETKRIQRTFGDADFNDLPKRAKMSIAIRDALVEYTEALVSSAGKLSLICSNLRREQEGEIAFAHYSSHQLRQDKAVYDASVQEFRRWGTRLRELFDKF
ncbi:MAG: hypothetical protein QNI91_05755 [Arenicellales bacterium]|nr:hypothetical protein [Arenicellales bacterium]